MKYHGARGAKEHPALTPKTPLVCAEGKEYMEFLILIHEDDHDSYLGECPELPGCYAQANTVEELMVRMEEAIDIYLKEPATGVA